LLSVSEGACFGDAWHMLNEWSILNYSGMDYVSCVEHGRISKAAYDDGMIAQRLKMHI